MNRTKIIAAATLLALGVATAASAQPRDGFRGGPGQPQPQAQERYQQGGPEFRGDGRGGPDRGGPGYDRRGDDRRNDGPGGRGRGDRFGPGDRYGYGAGPDRNFHRGDRLPPQYRNRQYVVDNWRAHRLSAPPRGQQWVQVGADYALVAIATGVIASILLNQ